MCGWNLECCVIFRMLCGVECTRALCVKYFLYCGVFRTVLADCCGEVRCFVWLNSGVCDSRVVWLSVVMNVVMMFLACYVWLDPCVVFLEPCALC